MGGASPAAILRALPSVELRCVLQSGHVPFVVIKNLSTLALCSLGVTDDPDRHRSQSTPGSSRTRRGGTRITAGARARADMTWPPKIPTANPGDPSRNGRCALDI
jgi:hypothetical protein